MKTQNIAIIGIVIIIIAALAILFIPGSPLGELARPTGCYWTTVQGDFELESTTELPADSCSYYGDNYDPFTEGFIANGFVHYDTCTTADKLDEWSCSSQNFTGPLVVIFLGEDGRTCEADCGGLNSTLGFQSGNETYCGDGVCNGNETIYTCPEDCNTTNTTSYFDLTLISMTLSDTTPEVGQTVIVTKKVKNIGNLNGYITGSSAENMAPSGGSGGASSEILMISIAPNEQKTYTDSVTFTEAGIWQLKRGYTGKGINNETDANLTNNNMTLQVTVTNSNQSNTTEPWCEENDFGNKLYNKGTTWGQYADGTYFSFTDYCTSSTNINEYWCVFNTNAPTSNTYDCTDYDDLWSCVNGACIANITPPCGNGVCEGGAVIEVQPGHTDEVQMFGTTIAVTVFDVYSSTQANITVNGQSAFVTEGNAYVIGGIPLFVEAVLTDGQQAARKRLTTGTCTLGCEEDSCIASKNVLICPKTDAPTKPIGSSTPSR